MPSLSSRLKQKFFKRKPRAWHLTQDEVAAIDNMRHDDLVDYCVKMKEQSNKIVRALAKLRQAVAEIAASGE